MRRIRVSYSSHIFTQKGWLKKNRERSEDRRRRRRTPSDEKRIGEPRFKGEVKILVS